MTAVGVLLPARLETRFDNLGPGGSARLRVIVVPADIWFDRHDPTVSETELGLLRTAVGACTGPLLADSSAPAFGRLADQVGAGRAAWLVREFVTAAPDGMPAVSVSAERIRGADTAAAPRILRGLPRTIELWATCRDHHREVLLATLTPAGDLPYQPPEPGQAPVFWPDWDALSAAGLTTTIALGEVDPAGGPIDPGSIAVLTAVGVGGTDPSSLLGAHSASGEAVLVPPGTPTNVTPDVAFPRPTAEDWRRSGAGPPPSAGPLSTALGVRLPVPGPRLDPAALQSGLIAALWPALWGHAIEDLWGVTPGRDGERIRAAQWWEAFVRPEGPFPSLVVGDQPYGVLPATTVRRHSAWTDGSARWAAVGAEGLLDGAAGRAERGIGTVVRADTDGVLRALRQNPVSTGYAYRWAVPAGGPATLFGQAWLERMRVALDPVGIDPGTLAAPQVAVGGPAEIRVPLVEPGDDALPWWFENLFGALEQLAAQGCVHADDVDRLHQLNPKAPGQRHRLFLLWLMGVCRRDAPRAGAPSIESVLSQVRELRPGLLVRLVAQALRVAHDWPNVDGAADEAYDRLLDAVRELALRPAEPAGDIDRALRATLDCATHRLDALPAAVSTARLSRADDLPRVLGLYAWVDEPFTGTPGFMPDRAVLAPSPAQATAAAILRDRFVEHAASGEAPPQAWDISLDSDGVRRSVELVEAVSEGAHPAEVVGRQVEACFGRFAHVLLLRQTFPGDPDNPTRRTCNGLAAMAAWTPRTPASFATVTGIPRSAFTTSVRRELDALAALPGVIADVHLVEAVHATVQGGAAATARALDAVAGLGEQVDFRSQRTPVPGTPLATRVHLCLPTDAHPAPPPPEDERAVLADPVTAAVLDGLGDPHDAGRFGWATDAGPVTLADLGLSLSDLAVVDDTVLDNVAKAAGASSPPPPGIADVRRVATMLARCTAEAGAPADADELRARYARLHSAASALATDLAAADPAVDNQGLRHRALRWGIIGDLPEAKERLVHNLQSCPDPTSLAPVAGTDEDPVDDLVGALRRIAAAGLPGGHRQVVPVALTPRQAPETTEVPDPGEWRRTFEPVRPRLAEAYASPALPVTATHARGWGPSWTGRPVAGPDGKARPGAARELDVYLCVDDAPVASSAYVVLDEWQETLPGRWSADDTVDRAVHATMAFGFNAPGARPPQAVLLAVPPTDDTPLDVPLIREILAETRLLARTRAVRGRDLGRIGALLPSAFVRADTYGIQLDDDSWDPPTNDARLHVRIEQLAPEGDLDEGLRARVADPLWMLSRQWQLGEHQGENASSPALAHVRVRRTPLTAPDERPFADPASLPGAAVLEAAGSDVHPTGAGPDPFDTTDYLHETWVGARGTRLTARRHPGGPTDWWVVDARKGFRAAGPSTTVKAPPGRMRYPGAPAPGWFTLEDPDETVTAHLPDSAHVGSLFLLDVLAGHATDWYHVPLHTDPGQILTVRQVSVVDSFGDRWRLPAAHWPKPKQWAMYATRSLGSRDLLLWPADPPLLAGPVLERVVLGVDEDANLLWAVEDIVEGRAPAEAPPPGPVPAGPDNSSPRVRYRPVGDSPAGWHPYPPRSGAGPRRFRQALLESADGVTALPAHTSRFLPRDDNPVHTIDPATVPAAGLTLERRWVLARTADGHPVLWQRRVRRQPSAPPAMRLPFDVIDPA